VAVDDQVAVQRRTLRVLSAAQVLGGVGVGSAIAVGGLLAEDVSGSTELSGLTQTASVLGGAVAALPMARLMSRRGRRPGLVAGYLVAACGAVLMTAGAAFDTFPLVLLGGLLLGSGTATNLQSRYAAVDLADPGHRARALSVVVWATTVGVVLGPNLTGPGATVARALDLPELAGPLLFSLVAFAVASALLWVMLRPDPLLVARTIASDAGEEEHPHGSLSEALRVIRSTPPALLAVLAVAVAHTVMVMVMVMTPVHMRHEGAELEVVGIVISVHVAGMYALSPVVGWLSDRLGRVAVLVLGNVVLLCAVLVSGRAQSHAVLGVGLVLLGVGWSCALVAGSTLLSESVPVGSRPSVQGAADFTMGLCGAVGGALAGVVIGLTGYGTLNALAGALALPMLVLAALALPAVRARRVGA
jgi:MFS family permease